MRSPCCAAIAVLATLSVLPAQAATVSPAHYATREGNYRNGWPFHSNPMMRYQQVHHDLMGTPIANIVALQFRQDSNYNWAEGGFGAARTIDVEVLLAEGSSTVTTTFASNYAAPPTTVFPRGMMNLPDYSQLPPTQPASWTFTIPLAAPFSFSGSNSFLWEVAKHGTTSTQFGAIDGFFSCTTCGNEYRMLGTGCRTSTSGTRFFRLYDLMRSIAPGTTELMWEGYRAPPNAPIALLIGLTNPNLSIPGLCNGTLYTDALLTVPATSDVNGYFVTPRATIPYSPAYVNRKVFSQAAAPDATQSQLPLAASNGVETTWPELPPNMNIVRMFNQTQATAPTGEGPYIAALIVQLLH